MSVSGVYHGSSRSMLLILEWISLKVIFEYEKAITDTSQMLRAKRITPIKEYKVDHKQKELITESLAGVLYSQQ